MQRFGTPVVSFEYQPHPGQRESRFPQPKDRSSHRPKEDSHV